LRGLPKDREPGQFTRQQFGQGSDQTDERIHFAGGQRQHEFPFQTKLDRKCLFPRAVIPGLVQRTFQLPELPIRKVHCQRRREPDANLAVDKGTGLLTKPA
jgi:hypothetical protein